MPPGGEESNRTDFLYGNEAQAFARHQRDRQCVPAWADPRCLRGDVLRWHGSGLLTPCLVERLPGLLKYGRDRPLLFHKMATAPARCLLSSHGAIL